MNILNGIDEARRRREEQERTARNYTRMSNAAAGNSLTGAEDMPRRPEESRGSSADSGSTSEKRSENVHIQEERSSPQDPVMQFADRIAAAMGTDGEKLLILALIVLLGSEGADIALLAALAYLLL